jgi:hypothetical protein
MLSDIRKAFNQHISSLDWMDEGTKGKAVEKLEMMDFHVRAPFSFLHFPTALALSLSLCACIYISLSLPLCPPLSERERERERERENEGTKGKAVEKLEMMDFHVRAPFSFLRFSLYMFLFFLSPSPQKERQPKPQTFDLQPRTPNLQTQIPTPNPQTPNPKPQTSNAQVGYPEGFPGLEDEEPIQLGSRVGGRLATCSKASPSSKHGTYKTVKAGFWLWLSDKSS